ncbi:hypothetical protein MTO96_020555 [Rhipicephalus appendiculatus]
MIDSHPVAHGPRATVFCSVSAIPVCADVLAVLVTGGVVSTGIVHLLLTESPYGGLSADRGAADSAVELVNGVRVRRTLGIPYALPLRAHNRFGAPRLLDYQQYLRAHVGAATWLGGGFTRLGCPQVFMEATCVSASWR